MRMQKLTPGQQALVEENLRVVSWAIEDYIIVNEGIPGLGFDDLFQEGCLALMKAAQTYVAGKSKFATFARVVVRNELRTYCKSVCSKQKRVFACSGVTSDQEEDHPTPLLDSLPAPDEIDALLDQLHVVGLLESFLPEHSGVTRKGIEALIMKAKGCTGADIAQVYGVAQNNVGAWITRAKKKLLEDKRFLDAIA